MCPELAHGRVLGGVDAHAPTLFAQTGSGKTHTMEGFAYKVPTHTPHHARALARASRAQPLTPLRACVRAVGAEKRERGAGRGAGGL